MPTPTYTPLATKTLTSNVASVTFSSIVGTYRDLILVVNGAGGNGDFYPRIRFNGDTAGNYAWLNVGGNGSNTSSYIGSGENGLQLSNITYLSISNPGTFIIQIMDYSVTNKWKSVLTRSDRGNLGTELVASVWTQTSAISSLIFYSSNGNTLASGATLTLYGIVA